MICERNPDMVCITETKLKKNIEMELPGWSKFNIWRRDRKEKAGGGVCILTDRRLVVREIDLKMNRAEIVAIEISVEKRTKLVVVAVYVPPLTGAWSRQDHDLLKRETLVVLQDLMKCRDCILVCGDFILYY